MAKSMNALTRAGRKRWPERRALGQLMKLGETRVVTTVELLSAGFAAKQFARVRRTLPAIQEILLNARSRHSFKSRTVLPMLAWTCC